MKKFPALKQEQQDLLAKLKASLPKSSTDSREREDHAKTPRAAAARVTKSGPSPAPARSEIGRVERARAFSGPSQLLGTIRLEKLGDDAHSETSGYGMCRAHATTGAQRRYFRNWQVCRVSLTPDLWWIVELRLSLYGRGRRDCHYRFQWRELTRSSQALGDSFALRAIGAILHLSVNSESLDRTSAREAKSGRTGTKRSPGQRAREVKLVTQRVAAAGSRSEGGSALIVAPATERRGSTPKPPITLPPAEIPARPVVSIEDGWEVCPRCRGELPDCLRVDCENGWIRVKDGSDVVHDIALSPLPAKALSGRMNAKVGRGGTPELQWADHEAIHRADPNSSPQYSGDAYRDGGSYGSLPLHDDYDS
jgi:hypothetical protein